MHLAQLEAGWTLLPSRECHRVQLSASSLLMASL